MQYDWYTLYFQEFIFFTHMDRFLHIVNFDTQYNSKLWFSGRSNPFAKWETDVSEYIINASVPFSTCPASHIWHTFFIHMRHFALILFLCYILDETTIQINVRNLFFLYFQVSKRYKILSWYPSSMTFIPIKTRPENNPWSTASSKLEILRIWKMFLTIRWKQSLLHS